MRLVLLAPFPVHVLPGFGHLPPPGHHATWLPRIAGILEGFGDLEIHWITCSKAVAEPVRLTYLGQQFHLLPRRSLAVQMVTAFHHERTLIARLLRELRPDLVHAWGSEEGYAYAATDWAGDHLISMQGILTAYCAACPQPWLLRLQAWHERRVLRKARRLTVESPWGREHLARLAPRAAVGMLEYGVDEACFQVTRQPAERPLAVFVGTLSVLKGVDTLLAAFRDPRLAGVDLVLLGDGPLRAPAGTVPDNVSFLGHRPVEEVRQWMAKAWCLVHPTRADTSPNAVKEARVIGLPVVTTTAGGQTQYVEHGRSGMLVRPGDVAELVQSIVETIKSPFDNRLAGEHGRTGCCQKLRPENTAAELAALYDKQLREK